jgi:hypothetical protein
MIDRVPCPFCDRRLAIRMETDGHGRLVEMPALCECPRARRKRGLCQDCGHRPKAGPRSFRCEPCHVAARLASRAASQRRKRSPCTRSPEAVRRYAEKQRERYAAAGDMARLHARIRYHRRRRRSRESAA